MRAEIPTDVNNFSWSHQLEFMDQIPVYVMPVSELHRNIQTLTMCLDANLKNKVLPQD